MAYRSVSCGAWLEVYIFQLRLLHAMGTYKRIIVDKNDCNEPCTMPQKALPLFLELLSPKDAFHNKWNARLKLVGVLKKTFCHSINHHCIVLHAIFILVFLMIANSKPSLSL